MLITSVSLGLLQRNKDFPMLLEQANKMISRVVLLVSFFTKKEVFKKFMDFFQKYISISPIAFNTLYCKFRLARLCQVFADLVTNIFKYLHATVNHQRSNTTYVTFRKFCFKQ